jgi:TRAP-type transport system small permease protein
MIHVAWPLTGLTWLVFLGEQMWGYLMILGSKKPA